MIIPDSIESIESYSFYKCSGYESQLILSSSLTFIGNESFSFTSFSKVIYNGINEPKCEGTIGFPSEQIIYIKKEYKSTKFCE